MAELALSVSVLAALAAVILLFGYARLLSEIRNLQELALPLEEETRVYDELRGDGVLIVLVTDDGCLACGERLSELAGIVRPDLPVRYLVAHTGNQEDVATLPPAVEITADQRFIGRLAVGITPAVIVVNERGIEMARAVVGNRESFEHICDWAFSRSVATTETGGKV